MNEQRKFAQGKTGRLVENHHDLGPSNQRGNGRLIDRAVVMPGARGALLVFQRAVVVMRRGQNRAHTQVEQANDRCDGAHHFDDAGKLSGRDGGMQAVIEFWNRAKPEVTIRG